MPHPVVDIAERTEALDPLRSFCVTAPAGSGKTELLIQRYLTLLARVEQPQEVLAITFTRKAAAEMRARIGEALNLAAAGEAPTDEHAARTYELARLVLEADSRRDWQLRLNPSQMNIRTIDSYCGYLTRQMPVLSRFGGPVAAVDDASAYYREATHMLLEDLESGGPGAADLATLLLHFDNNWNRLEELLVKMLACRDQWLVYMGTGIDRASAQAAVEHAIEVLCRETLGAVDSALAPWRPALAALWQYSRNNLGDVGERQWPGREPADVRSWQSIAKLLLTGQGQWRKQLTKREGFPAGKGEAAERKAEMSAILAEFAEQANLLALIQDLRYLPALEAGDEDWERVLACSRLLPQLAARLSLVFQLHGLVDHIQVSLAALEALGGDDAPTELALRLDYQLQHILVDEFQDTAVNQFELVRRLTRGWAEHNAINPEAPRTLFIVGDGMQSIYGFRNADVSLFIKAKLQGFDDLALEPLALKTNFRSSAGLVEWVNGVFADAFPANDNIQRGEIAFSSAAAFSRSGGADPVSLVAFSDAAAEARWIADQIQEQIEEHEDQDFAVLVRRKADLLELIPELKRRKLLWQAQDLDSLADSMIVRDLSNLTRALHNPVNRVAWMALLRAPWCGLDNADLLAVARAAGEGTVAEQLLAPGPIHGVSDDGALRIEALRGALLDAFARQERMDLRDWVEYAWLRLSGPACVESIHQLEDAEAFLVMLSRLEAEGERYSPRLLDERMSKLFAQTSVGECRLQLMTLHKAKGLEFDRVFIPNLAQSTRGESRDLLLWDEYHAENGESCFMLATDDQDTESRPTLYNYLYSQRKSKRRSESTRLLYVGATRAAHALTLSASLEQTDTGEWKPPAQGSLLATIWEGVSGHFTAPVRESPIEEGGATEDTAPHFSDHICRIARPVASPATVPPLDADPNIPERSGDAFASAVGTVIHLSLERLADTELPRSLVQDDWQSWWRLELEALGVTRLDAALARVAGSLDKVLADDRGRWLLSPGREEAACEHPVSCLLPDGRLGEYVIDRTFVEDGVRWVVDYKSSVPDSGQSIEEFIDAEVTRYRPQLESYRRLMEAMEDRPVYCALYFTAIPRWWELA